MVKLNIAYIVENDEDLFKLSFQSINKADNIIIVDGRQDNSKSVYENLTKVKVIYSKYPHDDKGADGKQRNFYLKYLQENHLGEWCLVLDADEVVDNQEQIIETINFMEEHNMECASIKMRHLVGNLSAEDSTIETHFVPCRLFKVTKDLSYDENEHPVLKGFKNHIKMTLFCIWHFGYSREVFTLLRKYKNHCLKSTSHTPQFLTWWYHAHLFGEFPTKKVDFAELPEIIKTHFLINSDYLYFRNRGFELKHAEMSKQWKDYFKPINLLDLGCGRGCYLRYLENNGFGCVGLEKSYFAIQNKLCESTIILGDITEFTEDLKYHDLVLCLDILEHLTEEELDIALENIFQYGKRFVFSIPFLGDPNLEADKTHKIFKSKDWWIDRIKQAGFKIIETPEFFYFKEQMVVATK